MKAYRENKTISNLKNKYTNSKLTTKIKGSNKTYNYDYNYNYTYKHDFV